MAYNLAQIQSLLRQSGWPESQIAKAAAIVMYESSGEPCAHNPRGEDSWGLLQINWPFHRSTIKARLCEPIYNLTYALTLWRARPNYQDWYNSNKKYLGTYPGTAAQKATWARIRRDSEAIYNGGGSSGGSNVQPTGIVEPVNSSVPSLNPIVAALQGPTTDSYGKQIFIVVGVGLAALLVAGTIFTEEY